MKDYHVKDIRNVAIVGHASTGKTSLAEALLFNTGTSSRMGTIAEGNTHSDYRKDEITRNHSISTSLMQLEYDSTKINILDAPGYSDFVGDALSAVRVADVGLITVSGTAGVEMGTEIMWDFCQKYDISRAFVITMLNKENTQFQQIFDRLKSSFGNGIIALQVPLEEGIGFHKIIDIIRKKVLVFKDGSGNFTMEDIPADKVDSIEELYVEMVEKVAESDDELMEQYFEQGELSEDDLRAGFRNAIIQKQIFPVFCAAATENVGVTRLVQIMEKYFPSPADMPETESVEGEKYSADEKGPSIAFVYKTTSEAHVGELSYFRVYSGQFSSGMDMTNKTRSSSERIGHIYSICGHDRTDVETVFAGDMGATVKLKNTHTGDTLSNVKDGNILKPVEFPHPNIQAAIVSNVKGEEDKVAAGLSLIHEEDPTFFYEVDPDLHQTIISGQGELQLFIAFDKLKRRFKVQVDMVEPKIPYRETIKGRAEGKYRHKKQSGGAGQFGEVWLRIEPVNRGEGISFEQTLVGQNVDRGFVPSVEKGVMSATAEGVLAGFPIVDVKAIFYDGKMHPVDSKDIAFQIAGKGAFKDAFRNAKPCLLEPVYYVEVKVPEEFMGDVMGDLTSRRGRIEGMVTEGHYQILKVKVPLANLYKYASTLRSITQGKAVHKQRFDHYQEVPKEEEGKIIEAALKAKEEE
jgi:elongation factor G